MTLGSFARAAERLVVPRCGLHSPFIFCCQPRPASAEAAGRLFIHGFPQEAFLELKPGPFQPPPLPRPDSSPLLTVGVDSCPSLQPAGCGLKYCYPDVG